jgi:hypothetical protein
MACAAVMEPSALHPQLRRIAIKFWRDIFAVEGSCRGRSQDRSDRLRLLLRFSYQGCVSACRQARMIVSLHRIFPHRREATGTTDWIGQLSASAGMCVPSGPVGPTSSWAGCIGAGYTVAVDAGYVRANTRG